MISFERYSLFFDCLGVLSDLSFEIQGPGLTGIVGPSGCGKSTLLKVMNRLILPRPWADDGRNPGWSARGEARFDGRALHRWQPDALRRRIGHVLQKPLVFPDDLYANLVRVRQHLERGESRDEAQRRAWRCLELAALAGEVGNLTDPVSSLSGGQEQRLCIARALVAEPSILCLDEPTSALDPIATAAVEETMQRIAQDRPVILVTHDVAQARLCDRVLFLHGKEDEEEGARLIGDGTPIQVFDDLANPVCYGFAHARERAPSLDSGRSRNPGRRASIGPQSADSLAAQE